MQEISGSALRMCAEKIIEILKNAGYDFSVAESCTGGLIAKSLTDIAGASAVFVGGCVTYSNEVKMSLLGVNPAIIERDSEVSYACAQAMAEGVRERLHTACALSTTGYAGPNGGTEKDPVGTVYVGIATPWTSYSKRYLAPMGADRETVRVGAAMYALELLAAELLQKRA